MKFVYFTTALFFGLLLLGITAYGQESESVEPRLLSSPKLVVPKEAKGTSLGGKVSVRVSLSEAGNALTVDDVVGPGLVCSSVDRSDVVAIRDAARRLALQSKFSPAKQNGQYVSSSLWVIFDFPGRKGTSDFSFEASDKNNEKHYSAADAPPADYKGPVNAKEPTQTLSGGALNGKASEIPRPSYPGAARAVKVTGSVPVQVLIDEQGKVFMAQAVDGHPLLRPNAVKAACNAKFMPTLLSGEPVKVSGIITYNFVP